NTLDQAIALYGNPVAMDIFIPSETDLSYIYLSVNEDVDITVKDQNGNQIDGYTYTESPIQDFLGTSQTNAKSMKIFQYPKPEFGNYEVILSNPDNQASEFTLDYYLFDKDGNLINGTTNGIVYT